jgi:AcrR family transcriptional regulator
VPASSTPARSSRRAAHPLTREAIVDAAIALVEREGPGALTMRRLGGELGVEAMALYHHLPSREALVTAIADRVLEPLGELAFTGDWRGACASLARELRDVALRSPATFRLIGLQPFDSEPALRSVERLLGVLVTAGFDPGDALAVYRAVASYARGYALAEATGFTVDAAWPEGRKRLRALPRRDFPILRARTRELAGLRPDAGFEFGLAALISGIGEAA